MACPWPQHDPSANSCTHVWLSPDSHAYSLMRHAFLSTVHMQPRNPSLLNWLILLSPVTTHKDNHQSRQQHIYVFCKDRGRWCWHDPTSRLIWKSAGLSSSDDSGEAIPFTHCKIGCGVCSRGACGGCRRCAQVVCCCHCCLYGCCC